MINPKVDYNTQILLILLIHSKLIDYRTYLPYCDTKILEIENPPTWLLDLSMNSDAYNYNDGSHICCYIEDTQFFNNLEFSNLMLACYYIGYIYHLWDWSYFLFQSGCYSDGFGNCKWSCDDFFYPLNDFNQKGFNSKQKSLERKFLKDFQEEVSFMEEYYNYFKGFYREKY